MREQKEELLTENTKLKLNLCSVLGFICGCMTLIMGSFSLPAIILSVVGLVQVSNNNERGKGFAITGIILGGVVPVLSILLFMIISQT